MLVAVARGGLIPGGGLSYALGVKLTDAINVEFYTDVEEAEPPVSGSQVTADPDAS